MPQYENMMITITILLFFLNGMFLATSYLPGEQGSGVVGLNIGLSQKDLNDMNNKLNGILTDQNVFIPSTEDLNVTASSAQKNYLTLFQNWLFSTLDFFTLGLSTSVLTGLSLVGTVISLFASMFFGYFVWLDFFLPSAYGGAIFTLNSMFKIFFFIVQLLGIYDIILRLFYTGTGTRG
jgi:hypothetical protein